MQSRAHGLWANVIPYRSDDSMALIETCGSSTSDYLYKALFKTFTILIFADNVTDLSKRNTDATLIWCTSLNKELIRELYNGA